MSTAVPSHLVDLIMVALKNGSVTRSVAGDVSMCWQNETGGRSTLSGIVDLFDGSKSEAKLCIDWAVKNGVLVIDYKGCDFNKVCNWVVKGPMMRELFEADDTGPFPAGHALSYIDAHEWCKRAKVATGCTIYNMPAPKGWRKVEG